MERNERIRWTCDVELRDKILCTEPRQRLGIENTKKQYKQIECDGMDWTCFLKDDNVWVKMSYLEPQKAKRKGTSRKIW